MPTTYWLKFGNTPIGYNGKALKTVYTAPGSLSVACNVAVTGSGFDATKQFGCTVSFGAVVPYTLNGVAQTPASSVHLLLVKDQTATLGNIPAGTSYSITEDTISQVDQDLGYSNGAVSGDTGVVDEGESASATINFGYLEPGMVIIDGRPYRTIVAGGNVWLAEDYRGTVGSLSHYSDISGNPPYMDAVSVAYDGETEPELYSYGAYRSLLTNPPQGWHIPTASEWSAFVADPVGAANIPRNDTTRLRYVNGTWTSPTASDSIWAFDYWARSGGSTTRANVVVGGQYNVSFYSDSYNVIPVRLVKDT